MHLYNAVRYRDTQAQMAMDMDYVKGNGHL